MSRAATLPTAPPVGVAPGPRSAAALAKLAARIAALEASFRPTCPLAPRHPGGAQGMAPPSAGLLHEPATDPARWQGFC